MDKWKSCKELNKLLSSYDDIIATQSIPSARTALIQTRNKLQDIDVIEPDLEETNMDVAINLKSIMHNINYSLRHEDTKTYNTSQYQVFLSYANFNKDQARELIDLLERNNISVFLSEKNISPMAKWENNIRDALQNSKVLFLLATPESIQSEWVTTEWGAAWAYDVPILPILYQCSVSDLPERLRAYQAINFHEMEKIITELKKYL